MALRQLRVCDFDETPDATPAEVIVDGVSYKIDLCAEHLAMVKASAPAPKLLKKYDPKAVRAWARTNGYDIKDSGRIPPEILTAYRDSQ